MAAALRGGGRRRTRGGRAGPARGTPRARRGRSLRRDGPPAWTGAL